MELIVWLFICVSSIYSFFLFAFLCFAFCFRNVNFISGLQFLICFFTQIFSYYFIDFSLKIDHFWGNFLNQGLNRFNCFFQFTSLPCYMSIPCAHKQSICQTYTHFVKEIFYTFVGVFSFRVWWFCSRIKLIKVFCFSSQPKFAKTTKKTKSNLLLFLCLKQIICKP